MVIQDVRHGNDLAVERPSMRVTPTQENVAVVSAPTTERITKSIVGGVAILVGAWGGLVPYIGHAIHFSADGSATWTWNLQHGLLYLMPAIAAVVGGSLLILSAWVDSVRGFELSKVILPIVTLLLGVSAIWFIVGPSVWPIFYSSHVFAAASAERTFAELVAYNFGAGVVLGAMAAVGAASVMRALFRRSDC
jgi:hypothetical protein